MVADGDMTAGGMITVKYSDGLTHTHCRHISRTHKGLDFTIDKQQHSLPMCVIRVVQTSLAEKLLHGAAAANYFRWPISFPGPKKVPSA